MPKNRWGHWIPEHPAKHWTPSGTAGGGGYLGKQKGEEDEPGRPSPETEAVEEDMTPWTVTPTLKGAIGFARTVGTPAALGPLGARAYGKMVGVMAAQKFSGTKKRASGGS